jgi:hypothetical protein
MSQPKLQLPKASDKTSGGSRSVTDETMQRASVPNAKTVTTEIRGNSLLLWAFVGCVVGGVVVASAMVLLLLANVAAFPVAVIVAASVAGAAVGCIIGICLVNRPKPDVVNEIPSKNIIQPGTDISEIDAYPIDQPDERIWKDLGNFDLEKIKKQANEIQTLVENAKKLIRETKKDGERTLELVGTGSEEKLMAELVNATNGILGKFRELSGSGYLFEGFHVQYCSSLKKIPMFKISNFLDGIPQQGEKLKEAGQADIIAEIFGEIYEAAIKLTWLTIRQHMQEAWTAFFEYFAPLSNSNKPPKVSRKKFLETVLPLANYAGINCGKKLYPLLVAIHSMPDCDSRRLIQDFTEVIILISIKKYTAMNSNGYLHVSYNCINCDQACDFICDKMQNFKNAREVKREKSLEFRPIDHCTEKDEIEDHFNSILGFCSDPENENAISELFTPIKVSSTKGENNDATCKTQVQLMNDSAKRFMESLNNWHHREYLKLTNEKFYESISAELADLEAQKLKYPIINFII